MLKKHLYILFIICVTQVFAQPVDREFEAQAIGGKEQIERIIETQLTLPKPLLTSNFDAYPTAYFDIDSAGNAVNVTFKSNLNNALRLETARILRFMKFRKTQDENFLTYPYSFTYHITTEKYNKLLKQKSKIVFKKPQPADSSYIVYTKADKAPEYYRNGDEGLKDFILSEIEYPKLAIEKSVEGTVVIEFVVETNGYTTSINLKQGLGAGCSEEALRLIKNTKWQPAFLNGKLVRYKVTYPITFSLRNVTRDAASGLGQ